jgi:hypothetical protein
MPHEQGHGDEIASSTTSGSRSGLPYPMHLDADSHSDRALATTIERGPGLAL